MQDVIKKLRFKDSAVVLHAPADLGAAFVQLGAATTFPKSTKSTNTLVFINNSKELMSFLKKDLKHIEPDSVFWIAYPKGTSAITTDINRDSIRATAAEFGLATVAAISIDDTWSALRFRPLGQVGK